MKNILEPGVNSLLQNFYDKSTVFVPNKYSVILYGPAVRNTMSVLRKSSESARSGVDGDGAGGHRDIDSESFKRWEYYHYNKNFTGAISSYPGSGKTVQTQGAVHLKWACNNVTIPTLDTQESDDKIIMDTYKNIKFHLIGNYDANAILTISVIEEKGMMWYQFFNALGNQFFNAQALIPRDSLHKLTMIVVPLITNEGIGEVMAYEKGQIFEFNSIIYRGMGNSLKLSNESTDLLKYDITFTCPNPFQKSFNKQSSGMSNRVNDANYLHNGSIKLDGRKFEDNSDGTTLAAWD